MLAREGGRGLNMCMHTYIRTIYVYICICTYTNTYTHTCTHMHACTTSTFTYVSLQTHTRTEINMHACMNDAHTYTYTHIHVDVCICVHTVARNSDDLSMGGSSSTCLQRQLERAPRQARGSGTHLFICAHMDIWPAYVYDIFICT